MDRSIRLLAGMVVILSVEFMDYDINKKNVIETDLILMKYYQSIDRRLSIYNVQLGRWKERNARNLHIHVVQQEMICPPNPLNNVML